MGYILHHAIVVTSWNPDALDKAVVAANHFGLQCLGPSQIVVNGYRSLLICPDGHKEGWEGSDEGDTRRKQFREWLRSQAYDDGSTCLAWFEVAYGSDDETAKVQTHAWDKL